MLTRLAKKNNKLGSTSSDNKTKKGGLNPASRLNQKESSMAEPKRNATMSKISNGMSKNGIYELGINASRKLFHAAPSNYGRAVIWIFLGLFVCVSAPAAWIRNSNGGARGDVKNNNLGCDLAYITRYQVPANEYYLNELLYNTKYLPGTYGGHLRILTKTGNIIALSDKLPGNAAKRDISDMNVSFDAKRIVFCARESEREYWKLYEIELDTNNYLNSKIKSLTPNVKYDCTDPNYRADGTIVFTSNKPGTLNEYEMQLNELLHIIDPAAANPEETIRQISFFQSGDYNPMLLNDGRMLWMRYEHQGPQDYFPLMVSRPDGTYVEEMFGFKMPNYNYEWIQDNIRVFHEFTQMPEPDNRIISTAMWHFFTWEAGALVLIDPKIGPTDYDLPNNLTPEISTTSTASPIGRFRTPFACNINGQSVLLTAYSPGPVSNRDSTDRQKVPDFGIWKMKWVNNDTELEPDYEILNTSRHIDINPRPLITRPTPPLIPSYYDKTQDSGELLCLNVNENSLLRRGFSQYYMANNLRSRDKADVNWEDSVRPTSSNIKQHWAPTKLGSDATTIHSVRVIQGLPIYALGNTFRRIAHHFHEPKRVLGEVPVKSDGSFRVRIPTGTPVHFQTLDKNGMVISSMQSWAYLNPTFPAMQTRVCIGCHEVRGHAVPENLGAMAIAAQQPAVDLSGEGKKSFSQSHAYHFTRDIYPIFKKHCLPCHDNDNGAGGYKVPDGNFDLSDNVSPIYNVAFDSLRVWISTDNAYRRSELLRRFTRANKVYGCGMPRAPQKYCDEVVFNRGDSGDGSNYNSISEQEWKTLVEWMDIGAMFRYYGDGQVQTTLPAQTTTEYYNSFSKYFTSCNSGSCHRSYSQNGGQYDANLTSDFADYNGGPTVPGEYHVNLSWPDRSRLLRAPLYEDFESNVRCRDSSWYKGSVGYQAMYSGIRTAQDLFIGETSETLAMARRRCNTKCHDNTSVQGIDVISQGEPSGGWKFTIMKMVMNVYSFSLRPERSGYNPLGGIGWSIKPPEAALIHKVLTNNNPGNDGRSAQALYDAARALRYPSSGTYTQAGIEEAQRLLWIALAKEDSHNSDLENLIRLELGVLFTQYLSPNLEDQLFEAMQTSRPNRAVDGGRF